MSSKEKPEVPMVWAWELENGKDLCRWARPSKEDLLNEVKPCPTARPVCARLIRNRDWQKLR